MGGWIPSGKWHFRGGHAPYTFVKESMNIKLVSETGIVENMTAVVKDFKETRGLLVSSYMCHGDFVSSASSCMHFAYKFFAPWCFCTFSSCWLISLTMCIALFVCLYVFPCIALD